MKKIMLLLLFCFNLSALKIDRVILSCDTNPTYIQFWPIVAKAWKQLIGIQPTLALIAEDNIEIDTSLGDVIRIKPIPNIPTSLQSQVIRLLLPAYFENEVCLISDIDMLPLNKDYFVNSIKNIPDDKFVVYRNMAYGNMSRLPMCYNAGKGYLFKEIFKIRNINEIPEKIKYWHSLKLGWETDEKILTKYLLSSNKTKKKCIFLHHRAMPDRRIDRSNWQYDKKKLKEGYYIDAHMVRPLDKYYKEIKELLDDIGLGL